MELFDWFKGFEKGIAKLTEAQRETFFRECGKNCVQCGTLQIYKDLYEQAAGDLDLFFTKANELPGVRCETIEKGAVYNLYFLECTCGLHHRPAGLRPQVSRRSQEDEKKKRQTSFDRYLCIHHDRKKANDVPEM